MIGLQTNLRPWFAAVGLAAAVSIGPACAAGLDPSKMDSDEVKALEQRLTDAGCYKGGIDGKTSPGLDDAINACPDERSFLRIETGMHTAAIKRIGVDSACSVLAPASDDKTVRLWSLPDGRLKSVIRLPLGEVEGGKVVAAAMSADGRLLAVSRADGYALGDGTTAALYLLDISKTGNPKILDRISYGSRILQTGVQQGRKSSRPRVQRPTGYWRARRSAGRARH